MADHGRLSATLAKLYDADVIAVDSALGAVERLVREQFDLVLVNRVFDADGSPGLDFIRALKKSEPEVPVMLVSNYADSQREAAAAGALPGFGKAELGEAKMHACLREVLE
jgi:CheY-like chemotaxis protein